MEIVYLPTNSIKPYEKNAKMHSDEQVVKIANSISEFGFQQPVVVDKNNVLIIGHGRLLAAKLLNLEKVPAVQASELTDEQVKALRLADNRVAKAKMDTELIGAELSQILKWQTRRSSIQNQRRTSRKRSGTSILARKPLPKRPNQRRKSLE